MNESPPCVMIIGGGVAGMAAAQILSDFDVSVHIVEKRDRLGGHSAMWACMATGACENCGACLSIDMVNDVSGRPNVDIHFSSRLLKLEETDNGMKATLEDGKSFVVQKVIVATGFSPFDPGRITSFHTDCQKNVITTARLNTLLNNEALNDFLDGNTAPDIAFIQCVGSRNRKIGNDYCSQVCCKVAMRHANKLLHLLPHARITIFYMDLQVIGKETRSFYKSLAKQVDLVQGVPAEILENSENGRLRIVTENRDDQARLAREYDAVVLSVGMTPSPEMEDTADILGISQNGWGFFNTADASLASNIHLAGCARTPVDIVSSMQDGRIAGGRVLGELGLARALPAADDNDHLAAVAVFGEGEQAVSAASAIAAEGYRTVLLGAEGGPDPSGNLSAIDDARILQVSGTAGNFSIVYASGGKRHALFCRAIVSAEAADFSEIDPGVASERIFSLAAFSSRIANSPETVPENVVILLDYGGPEYKKWARMALQDAIGAKDAGKSVSILATKMLVHRPDGQRVYDAARKAGVNFLRYEKPGDIRIEKIEKGFSLMLKEATLPSAMDIHLECGCLVIPAKPNPAPDFQEKAGLLRQKTDAEGFLQSPNVRHRPTGSTRKGIFFAGNGHDETDTDDLKAEVEDVLTFLKTQPLDMPPVDSGVEINEKMCAKCLTCYRICPHGAIVLTEKMKPRIIADACFSCHLCMANCPAHAIESIDFTGDALSGAAENEMLLVYACERSGFLAASGTSLPDGIKVVKIPCACRINIDVILKALLKGASKVVVAGCHNGNCRSMEGAREAALGVRQALRIPGMEESRVVFEPVAANESVKFKRIVSKA